MSIVVAVYGSCRRLLGTDADNQSLRGMAFGCVSTYEAFCACKDGSARYCRAHRYCQVSSKLGPPFDANCCVECNANKSSASALLASITFPGSTTTILERAIRRTMHGKGIISSPPPSSLAKRRIERTFLRQSKGPRAWRQLTVKSFEFTVGEEDAGSPF